jgi:hypothetical protein
MGTDIETLHENDLGKRSSSIRSESGTLITAQRAQYNDTNMAYTLSDINIQRA